MWAKFFSNFEPWSIFYHTMFRIHLSKLQCFHFVSWLHTVQASEPPSLQWLGGHPLPLWMTTLEKMDNDKPTCCQEFRNGIILYSPITASTRIVRATQMGIISTVSLPGSKSTFSQPFKEKCLSEVVTIGSIILCYLSKLRTAKFSILCAVILLMITYYLLKFITLRSERGQGRIRGSIIPFTPESDQCQNSPAASQEIWHHTVWRTWLFIAYSDEKWLYYKFSLHHSYNRFLKGWENTLFELRSERVMTCINHMVITIFSRKIALGAYFIFL